VRPVYPALAITSLALTACAKGPGAATTATSVQRVAHPLPGCTADLANALDRRLVDLDARILQEGSKPIELPAALTELREIWKSPCLAHVARFLAPPTAETKEDVARLFTQGLRKALRGAVRVNTSAGPPYLVVPPALPLPLDSAARRSLEPWLCAPEEPACGGRAASYIARAEASFDRAEREQRYFRASRTEGSDICSGTQDGPRATQNHLTRFEAWASCVIAEAGWTHRYARLRYHAPERGWLVLRGRRGHYSFADEVRAYDLETGAAYVARSESELVLEGIGVDHAAVDAKRKPEVFAARAVPDQVRELAFVLVTMAAVTPARTEVDVERLPDGVALTLTPAQKWSALPVPAGPVEWRSSAQTAIAFSLVEDGKMRAEGEFTWPDSWKAAEDHAGDLVDVLEAGLERGCAPVLLPRGIAFGAPGRVSPIDADPNRQRDVFHELAQALEKLPANVCGTKG
jgi:hypothetical protein